MYFAASLALVACFLLAILLVCGLGARMAFRKTPMGASLDSGILFAEKAHYAISALMTASCIILLAAFVNCDFRVQYVHDYSSTTLPLFYRVTAFWAGQPGSMLFWAWTVVLSGLVFMWTRAYHSLLALTRIWYWVFYFAIVAFFCFLLITWCDPFILAAVPMNEGYGLNPLLQNPGMIFHPPLLFLGYGGFVIPGCLALAQTLRKASEAPAREPHWGKAAQPFTLVGWSMLTAGIILGAWWAYMELGWGGYWAWDPVENASLIPWLVGTACIHVSIIEVRRNKLGRLSTFLMVLTTISAFFATYLVRSGVVQSLHAFGDGGIGLPFLLFIAGCFAVLIPVCRFAPAEGEPLGDPFSKEGLLLLVAWLMLALSMIILIATMWPVIIDTLIAIGPALPEAVQPWLPVKAMGLEAAFYNKTCLPLFAAMGFLLLLCPYRKWVAGFAEKNMALFCAIVFVALIPALWFSGVRLPLSVLATAASGAAILGLVALFVMRPSLWKVQDAIRANGVHLGLLLVIIGVAFSGPFQQKGELVLAKGQSAPVGGYAFMLSEIYTGKSATSTAGRPNYEFHELEILVEKDGKPFGVLSPQMRKYAGYEDRNYPEVSTIFSVKDEVYATFVGLDGSMKASIIIHVNPLVNWLWIGGTLMSLFPLLIFFRTRRPEYEESAE